MSAGSEKSPVVRALLKVGVVVGAGMVIVPFILALTGIGFASRVQGGLRGATHHPELAEEVTVAYVGTSLLALLAPPGILLGVMCGLALVERKKAG
jgi:hypothetical protein